MHFDLLRKWTSNRDLFDLPYSGNFYTCTTKTTKDDKSENYNTPEYIGAIENEDGSALVLLFNIAGYKPESFEVTVKGRGVVLSSKKLIPTDLFSELYPKDSTGITSTYSLTLTAGASLTKDGLTSTHKDGILKIVINKHKDESSGSVKIKAD